MVPYHWVRLLFMPFMHGPLCLFMQAGQQCCFSGLASAPHPLLLSGESAHPKKIKHIAQSLERKRARLFYPAPIKRISVCFPFACFDRFESSLKPLCAETVVCSDVPFSERRNSYKENPALQTGHIDPWISELEGKKLYTSMQLSFTVQMTGRGICAIM